MTETVVQINNLHKHFDETFAAVHALDLEIFAGEILALLGPSGCGKTTTAMAGDHFVGDDLAQMWIADDGSIRSVNPECGIFGIVEDVNWEGDPKLMDILRKPGHEVIWSNVLIDENGVPRWTGDGDDAPEKGTNFQGRWHRGMTDAGGKGDHVKEDKPVNIKSNMP